VGDREVLDLAAAVAWARQLGHRRVITVGFSMGGSVVLRHAALQGAGRAAGVRSTGEQTGAGAGAHAGAAGRERGAGGAERGAGGTGDRPAAMAEAGAEVRTKARPVVGAVAVGADAHADAVVSVSAPARWYYRGTAPMRRLHWLVTRPEGRIVGRYGFRTRIHSRDWDPVPLSPVESVPLIAPTPLLIVHGDRDPYFPLDHPRMLAAAAAAGAGDLWLEQGMGHAERATPDALLERIAAWSAAADRDGDVTGAP
jgi:pimeloyl-ACP methyl ester carboxylesterase